MIKITDELTSKSGFNFTGAIIESDKFAATREGGIIAGTSKVWISDEAKEASREKY